MLGLDIIWLNIPLHIIFFAFVVPVQWALEYYITHYLQKEKEKKKGFNIKFW